MVVKNKLLTDRSYFIFIIVFVTSIISCKNSTDVVNNIFQVQRIAQGPVKMIITTDDLGFLLKTEFHPDGRIKSNQYVELHGYLNTSILTVQYHYFNSRLWLIRYFRDNEFIGFTRITRGSKNTVNLSHRSREINFGTVDPYNEGGYLFFLEPLRFMSVYRMEITTNSDGWFLVTSGKRVTIYTIRYSETGNRKNYLVNPLYTLQNLSIEFEFDDENNIVQYTLMLFDEYEGQTARHESFSINYTYGKFDEYGNWLERFSQESDFMPDGSDRVYKSTREIIYY